VWYELGWTTLPGLRGLRVSDFRAAPTENPELQSGVAADFADASECEAFLKTAEAEFAARQFSNSADAFDTVKAYVFERARKRI
jgi:hypothetical protein